MHIQHLQLSGHDVAAQRDWYAQAGWEVADPCRVRIGASWLEFVASPHPIRYHYAIAVKPGSMDAVQQWCLQHYGATQAALCGHIHVFAQWQAHAVYVRDALGNIVEFIAHHQGTHATHPSPFAPDAALAVCEIGIAAHDVTHMAAHLRHTYALPDYYDANDTFHAVGTDSGRFIVVAPHRTWYPEQTVPAQRTPLRITFADATGTRHELCFGEPDALPQRA